MPVRPVPELRIRAVNAAPFNPRGQYVLHWITGSRRVRWSFTLQRAVQLAEQFDRPVLVFEAVRAGYEWASDRLHTFILQGMAENRRRISKKSKAGYYAYVEPRPDEDKGLLVELARHACAVVTDDFPSFFLPRMVASAAKRVPARLEAVDDNGLLPLRATDRTFPTAFAFRAFLQRELPRYLTEEHTPLPDPLKGTRIPPFDGIPRAVTKRWPEASDALLSASPEALAELEIDHSVPRARFDGGSGEGDRKLEQFVTERLQRYPELRNEPQQAGTSELSPYLHFGHVAAHQVFAAIAEREGWTPRKLSGKSAGGKRAGFWKMSEPAEAFLDEFITWRELAYNFVHKREDHREYDALPEWAKTTLKAHEKDPRPVVYSLRELEEARTHDPLWNATQMQLVRDGWFHNYLRMLWGKKILEWTPSPREALRVMEQLMNRWSLDGRNACSYSGYQWVLGRFDRPWGPERKVFGKIRYMSSENTARKLKTKDYVAKYAP